jgi:glucans biosynthesis protein
LAQRGWSNITRAPLFEGVWLSRASPVAANVVSSNQAPIPEKSMKFNRRQTLLAAGASAFSPLFGNRLVHAAASGERRFGPAQPFDFAWLKREAQLLAERPYQEPAIRHADILETIDYDTFQQIRFEPERALWAEGGAPFPVQFFHLGR